MSKHADHILQDCPDPNLCQQKPIWQITTRHTGTSHSTLVEELVEELTPVGRVRVLLPWQCMGYETELWRKIDPGTSNYNWERIH